MICVLKLDAMKKNKLTCLVLYSQKEFWENTKQMFM